MSEPTTNFSGEFEDRKRKLKELQELDPIVYKERFEKNCSTEDALKKAEKNPPRELEKILEEPNPELALAGRLMLFRPHGKLTFAQLRDDSEKIQICFMNDLVGADQYQLLKKLDLGDFLGVRGELFITKHGETTLLVTEFKILSKTLRPLPEKFHGLQDTEAKYRYRYLDLISDEETLRRFRQRSKIIKSLRNFLDSHGFEEVETPILTSVASGATATPFETHHKALDIPMFLRIAPETYLKRCIVGGFEKVYELGKCFRNEGIDPSHLQEFTMLEYYASYWNYEDNMDFTEQLVKHVIQEVSGKMQIEARDRDGNVQTIDFDNKWPRHNFVELIFNNCGIDVLKYYGDAVALRQVIKEKNLQIENVDKFGYGNLCDALYKKVARPKLIQPCFVIKHPVDTKPLARRNDKEPRLADSFQLLVNTWEVTNAYSELVDPMDQRDRLEKQAVAREAGDEEAMPMDEDYLLAMEHGMPPISGWGMGIDRFTALITNQDNLKDTVLFPIMRPLNHQD
jgi:lysyl-tRNA synthetase, class II